MIANTTTPTQMVIPADATGEIKRRLVLRNPLFDQALIMKLIVNPKNNDAIQLSHETIRIPARKLVYIDMLINTRNLGILSRVGHQIKGYVRIQEDLESSAKWLRTEGAETKRQLAFTLNVRSNNEFSAFETIIDLPGRASLVESKRFGRPGVDDRGVEDAIAIDADTLTARPFGSLENVALALRRSDKTLDKTVKAGKAEESCWFWEAASRFVNNTMGLSKEAVVEKPQNNVKTSDGNSSCKSRGRTAGKRLSAVVANNSPGFEVQAHSSYVNPEMNRVECRA